MTVIQMNVEVAAVFDYTGAALYWTSPLDGGPGHIQDTRALWDFIWDHRDEIHGVAHSHPMGMDCPSETDVTTWCAIEKALGTRLWWPIITHDKVRTFYYDPATERYEHSRMPLSWSVTTDVWRETIQELRERSYSRSLLTGEPNDRSGAYNGPVNHHLQRTAGRPARRDSLRQRSHERRRNPPHSS